MNEKDFELDRIVSVVINCTKSSIWSDNSITKEELLGKSKNENACMARAILVIQLVKAGFTISTISGLLRRTAQGIRHIIKDQLFTAEIVTGIQDSERRGCK